MRHITADPIRVALVGVGRMGMNHLRLFSEDPRFAVAAIVDPQPSERAVVKAQPLRILPRLKDLKPGSFDLAVVASPSRTHFEVGKVLLTMGKPVLIEKPLATSSKDARALVEIAKKHRAFLAVGHVERFNPAVNKLKEVIECGLLGKVIHYSFTRVGGYPQNVDPGNNVLLDLAVHDIDVLSDLAPGMKLHSSLVHSSWKPGIYDTSEILLSSNRGVSASLHANWITPTKIRTIRVTGSNGVCFVDFILQKCSLLGSNLLPNRKEPKSGYGRLLEAYRNSDRLEFGVFNEEPLKLQLDHLFCALRGESSRICSAADGAKAVDLAERAMKNAKKHRVP